MVSIARPNPLRMDPTRTTPLRRKFESELVRRFNKLKAKLKHLLTIEDAFGLKFTVNGWVTIKGHHILLGDVGGKSSGGINHHEEAALASAHKAAEMFGLPKPDVKFSRDSEQKTYGEHGEESVHLMNVHEGNPINKQLNYKADRVVTEGEHLAAHEVTHRLYSADSELGSEMMQKLKGVNAEYGNGVSMYGAFGGAHENLMELGASYVHSPEALKKYSPEMHSIAHEWVTRFKANNPIGNTNDQSNESLNRRNPLLSGDHSTTSSNSSLRTDNSQRHEYLDLSEIRKAGQVGKSGDILRRLDGSEAELRNEERVNVTTNDRFKFQSKPEQVEAFRKWLTTQMDDEILGNKDVSNQQWWDEFIRQGYQQGAGRAFDDVRKPYARGYAKRGKVSDFYSGTKYEFLRSSFAQPETIEKLQLLASRVFTELQGVNDAVSQRLSRELVEGLSRGENPLTIAKRLTDGVDSIGIARARTIARTEIIRAHNEGQLDALENMDVESVGVMSEWSTAMNACPLCSPMEGTVFTIKEARGMLPRHPNCRCTWIPAGVGENTSKQKKSKSAIKEAIDESVAAELPKTIDRTLEEQKKLTKWQGVDTKISKNRPKSILD